MQSNRVWIAVLLATSVFVSSSVRRREWTAEPVSCSEPMIL